MAEVLGIENPHNHMEEIFEQTLDIALDKKDPKRKLERRRKREEKKQSPCPGEDSPCAGKYSATAKHPDNSQRTDSPCAGKHSTCPAENNPCPGKLGKREKNSEKPAASRHVPSEVRERVLERAGYQCEYRSPSGRRCSCRTGLQVEHVRPYAVYKAHEEQYLRAFCPAHNLHAAKEYFGRKFVEEKIASERTRKGNISQSDKAGATQRSAGCPQASRDRSSSPAYHSSGVMEGFR